MARLRKKRSEELSARAVAELNLRQRALDSTREILATDAAKLVTTDSIFALLVEKGLPAEKAEKLRAALERKSGHEKRQERAEDLRAEIQRLNGEGMCDGEIARALGLSRPRICQLRGAHGIPAVIRKS